MAACRYRRRRAARRPSPALIAAGAAVLVAAAGFTAHHHRHAPAYRHAAEAIAYARAQLGKPYEWGGTGPGGFDCSGLVMMAYESAGVSIPRTTEEQWATLRHVSTLRPGTLIYYAGADGTQSDPGHVVLYIGHQHVIQAYGTGFPVMVTALGSVDAGPLTGYARP